MSEEVVKFGHGNSLVGIVHSASEVEHLRPRLGVVLLNSGILHRVGSGRLYVQLARRLAALGVVVLRFDQSGIGDSEARLDGMPWSESSVQETRQAIDLLARTQDVSAFVLGGICSGAVVALNGAVADRRVVGAMMVNAQEQIRVENWNIRTYVVNKQKWRRYFQKSITDAESWLRLISGRSNYRGIIRTVLARLEGQASMPDPDAPELIRGARKYTTLIERGVDLLLLYSDRDPGLGEIDVIFGPHAQRLRQHEIVDFHIVTEVDHLFTSIEKQQEFLHITTSWISRVADKLACTGRV